MKKYILFILSFLFISLSFSQQYNNEWINFDQEYYKIQVGKTGLVRVSGQVLINAGMDISNIADEDLALYRNGVEVPIFIDRGNPLTANSTIEFYSDINRGELETEVFESADYMGNPAYSLVSDSAAHFLTWDNNGNHLRYVQAPNNLSGVPPVEPYFVDSLSNVRLDTYFSGVTYYAGSVPLTSSAFEEGEGWSKVIKTTFAVSFPTTNVQVNGGDATVRTRISGGNNYPHQFTISVDDIVYVTDQLGPWEVKDYEFTVPVESLDISSTVRFTTSSDGNSIRDWIRLAYVNITYPRLLQFGNRPTIHLRFPKQETEGRYLDVSSFRDLNTTGIVYDLNNLTRQEFFEDGNRYKLRMIPASKDYKLYFSSQDSSVINYIEKAQKIDFIDYSDPANQGDYILLSNRKLYDDGNGHNYVNEYAEYMETQGYNVVNVEINQLYNQFGYGIFNSPNVINKFTDFALDIWSVQPENLFMIGRAYTFNGVRRVTTNNIENREKFMVPTYGNPGSDNLLTAAAGSRVPRIPTGRIALVEPSDIEIYLDKIKTYHQTQQLSVLNPEETAWMKEVLHLGGGNNIGEQNNIRNSLNGMANAVESPQFGGHVNSFFKDSSDPIQIALSERLDSIIDSGVSLITFFGHTSSNSFDFSIDNPNNYENFGRLPVFLSMGCYSGAIHNNQPGALSSQFVFAENKGAIAFVASITLAELSSLRKMGFRFYEEFADLQYGNSLGSQLKSTYEFMEANNPNIFDQLLFEHNTLHGDPSIQMYNFIFPDYYIESSYIDYEQNQPISNREDSVILNIRVQNLGKALNDSIALKISRTYPDNSLEVMYNKLVLAPRNESVYNVAIAMNAEDAIGLNNLNIVLDEENRIEEYDDLANNIAESSFFVVSDDVILVSPSEYGIQGSSEFNLIASSPDVFASTNQNYFIEIDTSELFNSPIHLTHQSGLTGNLLIWQPTIQKINSTVYYWRVAKEPTGNDTVSWRGSSFLYLDQSEPGWNQSHYFQFLNDDFENIELADNRNFEYFDVNKVVTINNGNTDSTSYIDQQLIYYINNQRQGGRSYLARNNLGGVTLAVLDSVSLIPLTSTYVGDDPVTGRRIGPFGNYHAPVDLELNIIEFPMQDSAFRARMVEFINTIPDNQYVLVYTVDDNHYDLWEPEVKQALTSLGATLIPQLTNHVPYGFIGRKGDPSFAVEEVLASNSQESIQVNKLISSPFFSGNIESTVIGPATEWNNVLWDYETDNLFSDSDTTYLQVIGVRNNRSEMVLRENANLINEDISDIDPNEFPYLKLKLSTTDDDLFTPGQMDYWRVLHKGFPEAIVSPIDFFSFDSDTIPQGEDAQLKLAVRNISSVDMDSLLVRYTVIDNANNSIELPSRRYRELPNGDTLITSLSFSTSELSGLNTLIVEINPNNDQFEQFHFNNFAFIPFYVLSDNTNPLLDVTFDGVHILDGDIVSPQPFIKMELKDENQFLALADTSLINVFISDPNGQLTRIPFDNEIMRFFPADQNNIENSNKANIEYRPTFLQDGIYELIVQARDVSNNLSGLNDYKTKFEVINKSMISNLVNYPNPFTTSTRFVFTLTGSILPTQLKIQIMTVTGKVVREITLDELGPIHIGRNLTDFAWDGTDSYGDRLANGVYFYRVVTSKPDYDFEHLDTGSEQFFKEGIGKMYLMR